MTGIDSREENKLQIQNKYHKDTKEWPQPMSLPPPRRIQWPIKWQLPSPQNHLNALKQQ